METMDEFCNCIEVVYVALLLEKGAILKNKGIFELQINNKTYFCYPRKGYAMNKFNCKEKISLDRLLKK